MAWWGALTQQFGDLAARTMKDMAAEMPAAPASTAAGTPPAKARGAAKKAARSTQARKTAAGKRAR